MPDVGQLARLKRFTARQAGNYGDYSDHCHGRHSGEQCALGGMRHGHHSAGYSGHDAGEKNGRGLAAGHGATIG